MSVFALNRLKTDRRLRIRKIVSILLSELTSIHGLILIDRLAVDFHAVEDAAFVIFGGFGSTSDLVAYEEF